MKLPILLFLVFLTSKCAHDEPVFRTLEERSGYEHMQASTTGINLSTGDALGIEGKPLERTGPEIANIWISPVELSKTEFFWGAWMSLLIEGDRWEIQSRKNLETSKPSLKKKAVKK